MLGCWKNGWFNHHQPQIQKHTNKKKTFVITTRLPWLVRERHLSIFPFINISKWQIFNNNSPMAKYGGWEAASAEHPNRIEIEKLLDELQSTKFRDQKIQ